MKNRIKELMKQKKISRDELAHIIGSHPVSVSRLISGAMQLNSGWIEKISAALSVKPSELFSTENTARVVAVRSHVQAGEWEDHQDWHEDDWYDVAIPNDTSLAPYPLYGAEARGPSMNKRYPEGTILVFTHAIETGEDTIPGKRYIVERERADGLREATVKLLVKEEDGTYWLYPESTDPRHQTPIEMDGNEGDTIRIIGQVRYSVVRE